VTPALKVVKIDENRVSAYYPQSIGPNNPKRKRGDGFSRNPVPALTLGVIRPVDTQTVPFQQSTAAPDPAFS